MTFWWDSSIAAKPRSHVAYNITQHGTLVSLSHVDRKDPWAQEELGKPLALKYLNSTSYNGCIYSELQPLSHEQVEPVWVGKRVKKRQTGHTVQGKNRQWQAKLRADLNLSVKLTVLLNTLGLKPNCTNSLMVTKSLIECTECATLINSLLVQWFD